MSAFYLIAAGLLMPLAGTDPAIPACLKGEAADFSVRWTPARTRWVKSMLANGMRDSLRHAFECARDGSTFVDLRGIRLSKLVLKPGNLALDGADLTNATLDEIVLDGVFANKVVLESATLNRVEIVGGSTMDNVVLRNLFLQPGSLTLSDAFLRDSQWEKITSSGLVVKKAVLTGARFRDVLLENGYFDRLSLEGAVLTNVAIVRSTIVQSDLRLKIGSQLRLEQDSVDQVEFDNSVLIGPRLSRLRLGRVSMNAVSISRPRLEGLDLEALDLRGMVWNGYRLGDESELDGFSRDGGAHRDRILTERHEVVRRLYLRLAASYRTNGFKGDANGFRVALRDFENSHGRNAFGWIIGRADRSVDLYGTSLRRWTWTAVVSLFFFSAVFTLRRLWLSRRKLRRATAGTSTVFQVMSGAFLDAVHSMLFFAEKVLNVDGLLSLVAPGRVRTGLDRWLVLVGGVWGLALVLRALLIVGNA